MFIVSANFKLPSVKSAASLWATFHNYLRTFVKRCTDQVRMRSISTKWNADGLVKFA